jgi:leucine dehydrogenase
MWHYADPVDATRDALRLAEGMTYKAAAAGLDLGGGKGVVCAPAGGFDEATRRAALLDFADLVESLGGSYVTAEDVGVSPADMVVMRERTCHVTGLPPERGGSGDPSPFTAMGVEAAMRACLRRRFGSPELAGRRVTVIGLGHVGGRLARSVAGAGADLWVSDVDPAKRALAPELGAIWVEPAEAPLVDCDVLAPCALGGAIHGENVERLRCAIVCGAANNQLADASLAERLAERGIVDAPDFIANAGGLINVYREFRGYPEARARELALGIEQTMDRILDEAAAGGTTPLAAALMLARKRLRAAGAGGRNGAVLVRD